MNKIDWKKKLTSRKFWVALATFVAMLIIYFGGSQEQADKTSALIMAGATAIAYIIGEGLADSKRTTDVAITDSVSATEDEEE